MEISTILGLGVALAALIVSLFIDGGHLGSLWSTSAFILIIGGTIGATIISYPMEEVMLIPKLISKTLKKGGTNPTALVETIVSLADKARREGLLALENDIRNLEDPFLIRGIRLVVDGTDPQVLRSILETDIAFTERRHKAGASVLETAGGFAPTIGIIGTVMGLVHVLGNLSEPDRLGPAIAVAFLATFYGIFTANIFWLPLANKLKASSQKEMMEREMILEGILSLQAGENPRIVREKLEVFLSPKLKKGGLEEVKGGEA